MHINITGTCYCPITLLLILIQVKSVSLSLSSASTLQPSALTWDSHFITCSTWRYSVYVRVRWMGSRSFPFSLFFPPLSSLHFFLPSPIPLTLFLAFYLPLNGWNGSPGTSTSATLSISRHSSSFRLSWMGLSSSSSQPSSDPYRWSNAYFI